MGFLKYIWLIIILIIIYYAIILIFENNYIMEMKNINDKL